MALMHRGVSVKLEKIRWWYRPERVDWNFWEVQLAGKKRMDAGSFLRGYPVAEGSFYSSKTEVDLCHTFIGTVPIYWLLSVQ